MKRKSALVLAFILVFVFTTTNSFAMDYTVKSGDTLSKISKEFKVSIDSLVGINKILNRNLIYTGQVLKTSVEGTSEPNVKMKPVVIKAKTDIDPNGGAVTPPH